MIYYVSVTCNFAVTGLSNSSATPDETLSSSAGSSHLTASSGGDVTRVKPFTFQSDASDNGDVEEEEGSSVQSFHTNLPETDNPYIAVSRQSGATRKTG